MTYMLTLEDKCSRPANRILPLRDRRAENVVKVPDEEPEGERPSAGQEKMRYGRAGTKRQPLRNLAVPQQIQRAEQRGEHDARKYDLVIHGVAREVAARSLNVAGHRVVVRERWRRHR